MNTIHLPAAQDNPHAGDSGSWVVDIYLRNGTHYNLNPVWGEAFWRSGHPVARGMPARPGAWT